MNRTISTLYWLGDLVYLRVNDEPKPGMITRVTFAASGSYIFAVTWRGGTETWHFECELTAEYVPDNGMCGVEKDSEKRPDVLPPEETRTRDRTNRGPHLLPEGLPELEQRFLPAPEQPALDAVQAVLRTGDQSAVSAGIGGYAEQGGSVMPHEFLHWCLNGCIALSGFASFVLQVVPFEPAYTEDTVWSVELSTVYSVARPWEQNAPCEIMQQPKYIFRDWRGSELQIADVRYGFDCGELQKDRYGKYLIWQEGTRVVRVRFKYYRETHVLWMDPDIDEREKFALENRRGLFGNPPLDLCYDECCD